MIMEDSFTLLTAKFRSLLQETWNQIDNGRYGKTYLLLGNLECWYHIYDMERPLFRRHE